VARLHPSVKADRLRGNRFRAAGILPNTRTPFWIRWHTAPRDIKRRVYVEERARARARRHSARNIKLLASRERNCRRNSRRSLFSHVVRNFAWRRVNALANSPLEIIINLIHVEVNKRTMCIFLFLSLFIITLVSTASPEKRRFFLFDAFDHAIVMRGNLVAKASRVAFTTQHARPKQCILHALGDCSFTLSLRRACKKM